ncbi:Cell division protein [Brugia malayi]|uniref:Septin n=4 Tax=Brugia TaxID=6278 RepID=A0A0J9YBV4_BRUMA|nr:Cell division protein [Brugia malayi]CDQ05785.1 BMA-UNC-59, isoform b [Brugia malayi]VIO89394.1 Cell division protein [Brugia malayi]
MHECILGRQHFLSLFRLLLMTAMMQIDINGSGLSEKSLNGSKLKDAHSYVGFANFPNQVFRRAIKNGFEFTLMVVGCSGLGKSTFINSLFCTEINDPDTEKRRISRTVQIEEKIVRLVENGVTLNLTLVDCPGFGDAVDNSKCWEPIVNYIEKKYLDYFSEETKIERAAIIPDKRVHLCLYFISPTGHGLKQLDIEMMKKLHDRVNVIPVIAKADTLTVNELSYFKNQITKEIEENGIKLYKFPDTEDEDEKRQFGPLRERFPFAIVGSNQVRETNGRRCRVRDYSWGTVEVENLQHNDFIALRDTVIRMNLIDLIAVTRSVHYENFRYRQLNKGPKNAIDRDPFTQLEHEKQVKEKELEERKRNMEKVFEDKVMEREEKLVARQSELDEKEKENRRILQERHLTLEQLMGEVVELRRSTGTVSRQDSRSSPSEKSSRMKKGLGGIFKN